MGVKDQGYIIVGQPEFFRALNAAVDKFCLDQWKAYFKTHLFVRLQLS